MIDAKQFMEALDEIEKQKGISKEEVVDALKEALRKAYVKSLQGGDDALVDVVINDESIAIYRKKNIVDEVKDDYIEISLDEANELIKGEKKVKHKRFSLNEDKTVFIEEVSVDELTRYMAMTVKSVLKQKLADAEKAAIYEMNKDKVGEMISGLVEKCDDYGAMVNIGKTTMFIPRKELIGDETFRTGDPIRLYVARVSNSGEKGSQIRVTRADAGYLKKLFEENVRDIYDGTVIIKNIARNAGIRSKVAVYSNNPNVDPCSSCIGVQGSTIQNILSNLGNARDREKVDIVKYSQNDAIYIIDAIKPATVNAIHVDKEAHKATIVVPDGQLSLAIGRRGSNSSVASKLTGYNLNIIEEKEKEGYADDFEITFMTVEEVKHEEEVREQKEAYDRYINTLKANREKELDEPAVTTGFEKAKPMTILDEDLLEEAKEEPAKEEAPVVEEQPKVEEEVKVEEPVKEEPKVVKTTTTLESLEKSLESEKKKESFKATQKTSRRPKTITEKEVAMDEKLVEEVKHTAPQMDIYTKEELEEFENEDFENEEYVDDEEIDYDDFDQYYDDDAK